VTARASTVATGGLASNAAWRRVWGFALVVALVPAGCETSPPPIPPKTATGAEPVAKTFFEGLMHEDWAAAYDTLDSESKAWCDKEKFTALARAYHKQIGFVPTEVSVSAAETDNRASAIAIFRGVSGTTQRQFKDGTPLRKSPTGWAVVLNKGFGTDTPAPPKSGKKN
jgi:hypothetical protein